MRSADRSPIRVVGRYALYNEIAAGGMATIHLGRLLGPVGFARTVAVKRLHPQFARDPEFVSMFLDEARLAARVQHPNVVATIDVVANEGELFLIMDYVRGESLSKILRTVRKRGQLVRPDVAAAIICGFLHGLHAAHEARNERGEPLGLVHRDVSPQNVLVGSDGIARVLDFGIAKATGRLQVTRDGQIKGKLAYMPPEQVTGKDLSRAVDIYAGAVVMWEMLTGERLFKGANEAETLTRILREPVPPPSSVHEDLGAFDDVLLRALSRDPKKRPSTARELALELERCCGIASATTVGEWVETSVGNLLNAREEQLAEIESSSVSIQLPPESDTDPGSNTDQSFASLPNVDAIRQAAEAPVSDTGPWSPRPAMRTEPNYTPPLPPPAPPLDEHTLSEAGPPVVTGSMSLPLDRRLPVLVVIAVILIGGALAAVAVLARTLEPSPSPPPPVSVSVPAVQLSAEPAKAAAPEPPATGAAETAAPSASTPAAKATPRPTPRPSPPSPPAPTGKTSCDPPFTIDASGRKKYKRECI